MKNSIFILFISLLGINNLCAQAERKADKETFEWRYEIEVVNTGASGTKQVKVWTYSKKADVAIEQAKKNAVHGILFKGMPNNGAVTGEKPIIKDPNVESSQKEFFDDFFQDGGKYAKYVTLVNNGAIAPGDRMKIGKEYKIGVVVSINSDALRKDLEAAGIIKALTNGF